MSRRFRFLAPLTTSMFMLVVPLLVLGAALTIVPERESRGISGAPPVALNTAFHADPLNIDPTTLSSIEGAQIVEQLFIGLVDINDVTGEPTPELATSWTVSPDKTVYTFHLRSDAYWSDGTPLTAQDVRYGLLRTLDPAVGAPYVYILMLIENAEEYFSGIITDPDLVGITAIDNTTLQIELVVPNAQFLPILGMWMARPLPAWTIAAHGDDWTLPQNIVTSGTYRLDEWVPNQHLRLTKNPMFYQASQVQIEEVDISILPQGTAWQAFVDGELDTVELPINTQMDPVSGQGIQIAYTSCVSYFGLNVAMPPFDDALVRKAFIAAADRSIMTPGLVRRVQRPAVTFTAPGVFGHNDEAGIPYAPLQAQLWLSAAGYPNGVGLPPVTLTLIEGSSLIYYAEQMIDHWESALGVSVTLATLPAAVYWDEMFAGHLQFWRSGWCLDYPDAYNYFTGVYPSAFGGWSNPTYEGLLDQARHESNLSVREALLQGAEAIVVEEDAILLPLYHYVDSIASKAYLQRSYPTFLFDIASWELEQTSVVIAPTGGSLMTDDGALTITVPGGTFAESVVLTARPAYGSPPSGNRITTDLTYDVFAVSTATGQPAQPLPGRTLDVTIAYVQEDIRGAIEETLRFAYWTGSEWIEEPSSTVNIQANIVTATMGQLGVWSVLGETIRQYMPLVDR